MDSLTPRARGACCAALGPRTPPTVRAWRRLGVGRANVARCTKLTLQLDESAFEAQALEAWAGRGAVNLYAFDRIEGALLLEECVPGISLHSVSDLAGRDAIAASLMRGLWECPPPPAIPRMDVELKIEWLIARRQQCDGADARLVDDAARALEQLSASMPPAVLLHGDLHPENILSAQREPWLSIDPAPTVGDPAFDLVRWSQFRHGEIFTVGEYVDPSAEWLRHIERASEFAGVDADRVRRWALATYVEHALLAKSWGADPSLHFDAARVLRG